LLSNRINKVLVIGTEAFSIINFRYELIILLKKRNAKVFVATKDPDNVDLHKFDGFNHSKINFNRGSLSFLSNFLVFISIIKLFKKVKPDKVLAYTISPVIWGGLSSRFYNADFYALITGLGFTFNGKSFRREVLMKLVVFLYKFSLKKSKAVIFQNIDNRDTFVEKGIVPLSKCYVVNGSGVDLTKYNVEDFPSGKFSFLCVARLLSEKGLREYAEAAKIVKSRFPYVEFNLVGPEDASPDGILLTEVDTWSDCINYRGSTADVRPFIKDSHVYVLPSYHEGLPRSTLEAMSMGRPVLTTNAVGCKETVEEGVNGFMVSIGSAIELAEKMIWYIENKDKINGMGKESRRIVEDRFDVHKVNTEMLRILGIK
jgi:glycosyltransferase involved in cell wall biosynthesis